MLHGTTGRTDLLGSEHTDDPDATRSSIRCAASPRNCPTTPQVYPTHGFGSFCSATPGQRRLLHHRRTTPHQPRPDPGRTDLRRRTHRRPGGLPGLLRPHGCHQQAAARPPSTCRCPNPSTPEELRRRIDAGEWVVDLRNRTAFAAGHLAGTLGFELSGSFVTYLGWLYTWGAPLTLIGDDHDQIADARRELVRIGIDNLTGSAPATSTP